MGGTWCQWCLADHAAAVGVTRACCLPHGFGEVLTGFLVSVVPPCLECVVPQAGGLAAAAGWVWPRGLAAGLLVVSLVGGGRAFGSSASPYVTRMFPDHGRRSWRPA